MSRQRDEVQRQGDRILEFVKNFETSESRGISDLTLRLLELNGKINDGQEQQRFSDVVRKLNSAIEDLVDNVIEWWDRPTLVYLRSKTGIEYSVLRSFLKPYLRLSKIPFVSVKAGRFMMRSPASESERDSDEVRHSVTLTKDFEISAIETTQLQWFDVMGSNPSYHKERKHCPDSHMEKDSYQLCALFPVERVSHEDVKEFLIAYNKRAEGKAESYEYRLPTEAEWEFTARGGTTTAYSFGDDPSVLPDHGWYSRNSGGQARAVALKNPNPLGLFDVHGNVFEWVEDWMKNYPAGSQIDPSVTTDPKGMSVDFHRVLRGGGWNIDDAATGDLRSANRSSDKPGSRYGNVGFRLVRTPSTR